MNQAEVPLSAFIIAYVLLIWTVVWKGVALWKAAKNGQRNWFIIFLVINPPIFTTLGILEIVYLFRFAKKRLTISELKNWLKQPFFTKEKSQ